MKIPKVLILVGILLTVSWAQTTYVYDFNTLFANKVQIQHPMYNIGYRLNGTTIQLNFTTPNTLETLDVASSKPFKVELEDIDDNTVTCTIVTGCGTGDFECVQSCPIIKSAIYRLYIWKAAFPTGGTSNILQTMAYFQMEVTSFLTSSGGPSNSSAVITSLFKATDTFREKTTKLIYIN